jgi:hypothetical protein
MFTTADDPGGDGHYSDLIQTIKFLQNDPNQTEAFQAALACYGRELLRFGLDGGNELKGARDAVKGLLHGVMVRTERLAMTTDRRGMLKEVACPNVSVAERDVEAFLVLQRLARAIQVADVTEYWKSAPYLLNFMDDYDLKRDFESRVKSGRLSPEGVDALTAECTVFLSKDDVSAYREMDPGNARLRHLVQDTLGKDAWQWLWMPPSWPYYELEGEYANAAARLTTKRLIFSSWQVVPKVVAAFLTYEAERRMLGIPSEGEPGSGLPDARKKRSGRLRFGETNGRLPVHDGVAIQMKIQPLLSDRRRAQHERSERRIERLLDVTLAQNRSGFFWTAPAVAHGEAGVKAHFVVRDLDHLTGRIHVDRVG